MNFKNKYKIVLLKRYFDQGYSITSYIKILVLFFGFGSIIVGGNVNLALAVGVLYGISCFIIGRIWIKNGWLIAEREVSNQNDLFVKEMRKTYQNGKV